jgi:regulator of RNase E activity RraA
MTPAEQTMTYRVVVDAKGWTVIRDGRDDPIWRTAEKQDALEYGRRVAVSNQPARLLVYAEDGTVESECLFGL